MKAKIGNLPSTLPRLLVGCLSRLKREKFFLFASSLLNGIWLLWISYGPQPGILADEYTFSNIARNQPLSQDWVNNYLYLIFYRGTELFGDNAYTVAKFLNVFFFIGSSITLFFIAKFFLSETNTRLFYLLAAFSTSSVFVGYFMPESMFFFFLYLSIFIILKYHSKSETFFWLILGCSVGLTSLVKIHGIVLLIPFAVHALGQKIYVSRRFLNVFALFSAAFATKFVISFLIAGSRGLTLTGTAYQEYVLPSSGTEQGQRIFNTFVANLILVSWITLAPTVIMLCLIALIHQRGKKINFTIPDREWLILSTSLTFISLSSYFSAQLTGAENVFESRIEYRYYQFVIPLLFLVFSSWITRILFTNKIPGSSTRIFAALFFSQICIILLVKKLSLTNSQLVDWWARPNLELTFNLLNAIYLIFIFLLIFDRRYLQKFVSRLATPVLLIFSIYATYHHFNIVQTPDRFSKTAEAIERVIPSQELGNSLLVESWPAGAYKIAFLLDWQFPRFQILEEGQPISLDSNFKWITIVGSYKIPEGFKLVYQSKEIRIVKK